MTSAGIRDRVAIVGMGCTRFGELWDQGTNDLLTDAAIEPTLLHDLLRPAAARTWNQLTVDGDTSTNDTVFVLASGASGTAPVRAGSDAARQLGRAIEAIARDLARQQAADGEGATTLLTCQVSGAVDDADANVSTRISPLTSRACAGVVVLIPTLPPPAAKRPARLDPTGVPVLGSANMTSRTSAPTSSHSPATALT